MTINELMQKEFWDADIPDFAPQAWEQGYQMGANAVLREIEQVLYTTLYFNDTKIDKLKELVEKLEKG